ncbi:unnamed protein product [Leptosia nina]|uniref:Uncharacterized protein n=1 Tax=Leptosia nina TaxID=320188 RepID=A0AAV1JEM4_9NEOP
MYTTWYSRGEGGMHHHQMGQLYHAPPMIKTEAGVNSDCMMAVDYAPPIKQVLKYMYVDYAIIIPAALGIGKKHGETMPAIENRGQPCVHFECSF